MGKRKKWLGGSSVRNDVTVTTGREEKKEYTPDELIELSYHAYRDDADATTMLHRSEFLEDIWTDTHMMKRYLDQGAYAAYLNILGNVKNEHSSKEDGYIPENNPDASDEAFEMSDVKDSMRGLEYNDCAGENEFELEKGSNSGSLTQVSNNFIENENCLIGQEALPKEDQEENAKNYIPRERMVEMLLSAIELIRKDNKMEYGDCLNTYLGIQAGITQDELVKLNISNGPGGYEKVTLLISIGDNCCFYETNAAYREVRDVFEKYKMCHAGTDGLVDAVLFFKSFGIHLCALPDRPKKITFVFVTA